MMAFCAAITLESIVLVEGTIQAVEKDVEATTIKKFELHISKVRAIRPMLLPLSQFLQFWTAISVNPLPVQISAASAPPASETASVSNR
jgi:hypothetical protein